MEVFPSRGGAFTSLASVGFLFVVAPRFSACDSEIKLADVLDKHEDGDDCNRLPPSRQQTARVNVSKELERLAVLSVSPGDVDRIMDADASVGRAPASCTHCPCLTHSRGQGLWLVSRGRRLRARETLAMQGIRLDDWSWAMSPTQIIAAAGNSMSVPILKLVFKELVRCTGDFMGPADPRLAFESRGLGLRDGVESGAPPPERPQNPSCALSRFWGRKPFSAHVRFEAQNPREERSKRNAGSPTLSPEVSDGVERSRRNAGSPTLSPEVSAATGRLPSSRSSTLALPSWLSDTLMRPAALNCTAPAMWASFTSTTLRARVECDEGRQRDLLPLPSPDGEADLDHFGDWIDDSPLRGFFVAVVAAINVLGGYGHFFAPRIANAAQKTALGSFHSKVDRMCRRLASTTSPGDDPAAALQELIGDPGGPGARSVPLLSSACDVLDRSGLVEPTPFLPVDYRELVADDEFMFPAPPAGLDKFSGPKGEHRIEYLRLMLREMRSGKTELRDHFRGGGTIFAVGRAGGKQRAVWDGKRVTGIAASPPKPPHLASPAALRDVEIRPGQRLRMWKRDGKCLFDQLRLPAALVPFMGRPPFTIREFCAATGISFDSAREFWRGRGALALDSVVYPVGRVWARGLDGPRGSRSASCWTHVMRLAWAKIWFLQRTIPSRLAPRLCFASRRMTLSCLAPRSLAAVGRLSGASTASSSPATS